MKILTGILFLTAALAAQPQKLTSESGPITLDEAKKLKSPIPYSKKSIAQGRSAFARNCVGCHGADGKAMVDVVADASDLTAPKSWKNGSTEGEIFRSVRDGQGASMPAFKTQIRQDDIWNLVNFIRYLWPEDARPPLEKDSDK